MYLDPPDRSAVIIGLLNGSTYTVIENDEASLSCSVIGGNPLAKPEWYCEHHSNITANSSITNKETVTHHLSWMAKRTNGKRCFCQTGHILSNDSVYVNIDVLCKYST